MSGAVGSEALMRRVKQEHAECPAPSATPSCYSPSAPTLLHMEGNTDCKDEIKYSLSPQSPDRQFCSSTTQPIGTPHTEETGVKEDETPRRLCLVCGDIASGFHYGVASCEACKAFFKRTIQGNIEYTCPAANECEINKRRRKACQACRFRKCLRTGMLREGVRLDRVRGGRQKYRRAPEGGAAGTPVPLMGSQFTNSGVSVVHARPALEDIKILEVLCSYEPDLLTTAAGGEVGSAHATLCALSDLYDRELVGVIGWAKQIPGFTELQLNDQMRLLQSTWAEMLSLMLAYRSMQTHTVSGTTTNGSSTLRLKFATDLTLDEQEAKEIGALELYHHCVQIIGRLERMSALKEECYLLKALALANSDARLDELAGLRRFRESIIASLNDAVAILRPYNGAAALQQLLLILPSLRQADHVVRRFWSNVHREGKVPMNKLFVEMLEAYFR